MREPDDQHLRVAVIGSGPAGAYCVEALLEALPSDAVSVDVLERLPVPYGLVRYGVAPDHERIKSIIGSFGAILSQTGVRFIGNVTYGRDISMADLRQFYDVAIFASGASGTRKLGIPGERLPGVFAAADFVSWYNGHPNAAVDDLELTSKRAVVIGNGNVALDVARMMVSPSSTLRRTDVPQHVLDRLTASPIEDVHIIGRRGPLQAKFTTKEIAELGKLDDVDVIADPCVLQVTEDQLSQTAPATARTCAALQNLAGLPKGRARRIHFNFFRRPIAVMGGTRAETIVLEANDGQVTHNRPERARREVLETGLIISSVGYRANPLPDLPFDSATHTVPHNKGHVLDADETRPAVYVAGWLKRGPTGVIGTNRRDALETVDALLQNVTRLPKAPQRDPGVVLEMLRTRGVEVVPWEGWTAIDGAEVARGARLGRERVKLHRLDELLKASTRQTAANTN